MSPSLEFLSAKVQIIGAATITVLGAAVENLAGPSSLEGWSFNGALIVAVIVLYRLLMNTYADMKELRDKHEERLLGVIEANTKSNERVCELAEEQASYFKSVTRDIVSERLHARANGGGGGSPGTHGVGSSTGPQLP